MEVNIIPIGTSHFFWSHQVSETPETLEAPEESREEVKQLLRGWSLRDVSASHVNLVVFLVANSGNGLQ